MTSQILNEIIVDGRQGMTPLDLEVFHHDIQRQLAVPQEARRPVSTDNWKNYIVVWEIYQGALYLKALDGGTNIPLQVCNDPLPAFAKWQTGECAVYFGKCLYREDGPFADIYEEELLVTIESGQVISTKRIHRNINEIPR